MYACTTCKPKPRCFLTPPIAIRLSPPAQTTLALENVGAQPTLYFEEAFGIHVCVLRVVPRLSLHRNISHHF